MSKGEKHLQQVRGHSNKLRAEWTETKRKYAIDWKDSPDFDYTIYENDPRTREEILDDIVEESIGGIISVIADDLGLDGIADKVDLQFLETMVVGIIDGMTAFFAGECRGGLNSSVSGAFRVLQHTDFLNP